MLDKNTHVDICAEIVILCIIHLQEHSVDVRHDDRKIDELRPFQVQRKFTNTAPGSALIQAGGTVVLCTASVEPGAPAWMGDQERGWVTAEYGMLPGSTSPRKQRDRGGKIDGRSSEIQRLIGRSLRAVMDLQSLGRRTITVDCDVLQADGGTRTAAITGSMIALADAIHSIRHDLPDPEKTPFLDSVAAVSVGIVDGRAMLDLDYREDVSAAVDMNVVMTGNGRFVELQGTGEEATFDDEDLSAMLRLARLGIAQLTQIQRTALGENWPLG